MKIAFNLCGELTDVNFKVCKHQ